MTENIKKWLLDVKEAIETIEIFLGDERNFFNYRSNLMLKRAVEREFEIIGEAINRILKEDENFMISNARRIINLRNHIIHAYDNVSDEMTWSIIVRELPNLKIEINNLLK